MRKSCYPAFCHAFMFMSVTRNMFVFFLPETVFHLWRYSYFYLISHGDRRIAWLVCYSCERPSRYIVCCCFLSFRTDDGPLNNIFTSYLFCSFFSPCHCVNMFLLFAASFALLFLFFFFFPITLQPSKTYQTRC